MELREQALAAISEYDLDQEGMYLAYIQDTKDSFPRFMVLDTHTTAFERTELINGFEVYDFYMAYLGLDWYDDIIGLDSWLADLQDYLITDTSLERM